MTGIYLRSGDGFVRMRETPYDAESVLQQLVASHPEMLAGDERDERRPWVLIRQEASIRDGADGAGRWWLDHLFVDGEGVLTLVEVKRSSDGRIRREVVGQMLDYAANAAHWPIETLREWLEASCAQRGLDPEEAITPLLDEGQTSDDFWATVRTNQIAQRLRLVFVADDVPSELRRVVEFLNGQMQKTEVLAIEVKQYVDEAGQQQTIVPRVVGKTEASRAAKGQAADGRTWDKAALLEEIARKRGAAERDVAERIVGWAEQRADATVWYGRGRKDGSVGAGRYGDRPLFPFALYTYGRVEIQFQHLRKRPPFDVPAMREELRDRLNGIEGVDIPSDALELRPSIHLAVLTRPQALRSFLDAMDWAFDRSDPGG